ncbi:hypothetical protein [Rathayibacter toxicus]|uniref:Uncharacterized protein n=1 Tax=Rathayibacter toxicus TaxID=145458 RepID=A0A0C5BCD7_9MICO|nr:hypothetical protein [Rathayibacter toxicus]AJM76846.1 hypothetical protein TI83_00390 [Rathayibacter toxicus]ALS57393.1 hypothetical protein APU90_06090 [Rathayibacter toxicus]KKM45645.1 hypothetical protein VT73_05615 [Rathayibacter toxicus]PPG24729.1 hypothetical protein C5D15_00195 [Rathayibacter toxicus]PPG48183.1 hypothetical protein C5D16_00205 [Rathayibacter toxicus]
MTYSTQTKLGYIAASIVLGIPIAFLAVLVTSNIALVYHWPSPLWIGAHAAACTAVAGGVYCLHKAATSVAARRQSEKLPWATYTAAATAA